MQELILWTSDTKQNLNKSIATLLRKAQLPNHVHLIDKGLPPEGEGHIVFAMGNEAVQALAAMGVVPKNRSINSLRKRLWPLPSGAQCMVSYSAGIQEVDYALYVELMCDARMAIRACKTGSLEPQVGSYLYVKDFSNAVQYVEDTYKHTGERVLVTMDLETWGLDPYNPQRHIVSVQVTVRAGQTDIVTFDDVPSMLNFNGQKDLKKQIQFFLTSPKVKLRGANFKYDLNWMAVKWGFTECTNFMMDTTIVGSLLDENRSNSLNVHAKVYTAMGGYDDPFELKWDKSEMPRALKEDPEGFKIYAGGDTDACYQASIEMEDEITDYPDLANFYVNIWHPAARAYEDVERVGWCVDLPYYEYLRDELEYEIRKLEAQAKLILGGRLVAKHTDQKTGLLNIMKPNLLKDFMYSPMGLNLKPKVWTSGGKSGNKQPSVAYDTLMLYHDHPDAAPFIDMLKEYGSATKTHGTYVVGFLKHLRHDGRFHPTYFLFSGDDFSESESGGAVTGRLSVVDPAIQTIPKHTRWAKKLRYAFIAPPGYVIVAHDYSQGELKIVACLSNEEAMIEAYRQGIDLHALTGSRLNGYSWDAYQKLPQEVKDAIRQGGKAGNFGLIYGMGAEGYTIYAWNQYGVKLLLSQGEEQRNTFFETYPGLPRYHASQKKFVREHGYVESPLGRIRHLPLIYSPRQDVRAKAERQAINSPTQSTLSDLTMWATAIMREKGLLKLDPVFGMVHDQNLRYCREDRWKEQAEKSKDVSENLPFHVVGWEPQLRFTVDTEVGPNLGSLVKVKELCG